MINQLEQRRQKYLMTLADIIIEEKLLPEESIALMYGEIASWLMVIANIIDDKNAGQSRE